MKAPPLFDHQRKSLDFMRTRDNVLDASDPGTGKTRVQIELFAEHRRNGGGCALVIAPKSLLRSAWQEDFKKYAPHITVSVCAAPKREEGFKQIADVYVTNTDAAKWLADQPASFFRRFDTLIIDELSTFKHHTSQRSKAINKVKKYFQRRFGLCGTTNTNSITDLWNQMFILDDGQRLGTSFFKFRNATQVPQQTGPVANMMKWTDRPGIHEVVGDLIKDMTVRHKFEECLDVPDNFEYSIPYHLSKKQWEVYKTFAKHSMAALNSGDMISAVNAASMATKLLQICSGTSYSGIEGDELPVHIDDGRYELVADLVEQRDHTVVFFQWQHQKDFLIKEFEKRSITYTLIDGTVGDIARNDAVQAFQAGFFKVLLAQPASAAHGLTLTKGSATIWASPTYNLEHWLQGNRRVYRAGQTKKTETIVIIAPGTIEERVFERLTEKNARQMDMLEFLKEAFKDIA